MCAVKVNSWGQEGGWRGQEGGLGGGAVYTFCFPCQCLGAVVYNYVIEFQLKI